MMLSGRMGRGYLQRYGVSNTWPQVLLCGAVLSAWHIGPIVQTYRMYSVMRQATKKNFEAGFNSGDQQMNFLLLPVTLIAQPKVTPGCYTQKSENPPDIEGILTFFKKSSIVVRPSAQWLHDRER